MYNPNPHYYYTAGDDGAMVDGDSVCCSPGHCPDLTDPLSHSPTLSPVSVSSSPPPHTSSSSSTSPDQVQCG